MIYKIKLVFWEKMEKGDRVLWLFIVGCVFCEFSIVRVRFSRGVELDGNGYTILVFVCILFYNLFS